MAADLAQLMARYCDGEASAFRALHAEVSPRLLAYLVGMAGDRALAEDLVQQTFLKVHRARAAYVRGADPVPWMFAIAHRTFLDHARGRKRARVGLAAGDGALPDAPAHITGQPLEEVSEPRHGPEETRAALAALEDLPANQREALVLTKLGGKSVAEAAAIAGTTPGAIKLRAHRGYQALRKALARSGA
jgi:RNA polymerase sigma-70 factor, ECF subfamily